MIEPSVDEAEGRPVNPSVGVAVGTPSGHPSVPPVHSFEFNFDIPFIKAALRRDILWRGYVAAGGVVVVMVGLRLWSGVWSKWTTAILAGIALGAVIAIHRVLNRIASRIHELWIQLSPSGVLRYELDPVGFTVIQGSSRSRFEWAKLRRLWRYDDVWLIEIVKMQSSFFPPREVDPEALEYIVDRFRAAGIRH